MSTPSIVIGDRQSQSSSSRPRPRSFSSRSKMSSQILSDDGDGDVDLEWDETIDGEFEGLGQGDEDALLRTRERERERRKRKKKDEPMSPASVVFYVIALYLIFQILTRSDESEILSHLPSTSNLRQSHHSSNDGGHGIPPYHLPYNFPQIPNPIPSPPLSPTTSNSIWRIILSVIIYPFYVLLTIISVPLPLVLHLLYIMKDITLVLLYPLTTTAKLFYKTFVAGPLQVVKNIIDVFYPIYVFIGGVVTVGCVIGASAGWAGRVVLDSVLRWKDGSGKKSRKIRSRKLLDPAAASSAPQIQAAAAAVPKIPAATTTIPMESMARATSQSSIARPPWSVVDTIRPSDSASQVKPRPTPTPSSTSSYPRLPNRHLSSYNSSKSKDKEKEKERGIYTPLRDIKIVHEPISLFDAEDDEDEDSEATIRSKGKSKRTTSSIGKGKSKQVVEESSADERAGVALARSTSRAAVVRGIRRRGVRERY